MTFSFISSPLLTSQSLTLLPTQINHTDEIKRRIRFIQGMQFNYKNKPTNVERTAHERQARQFNSGAVA